MPAIAIKRYAQAAFDIALKEGQLDSWVTDMEMFQDLLANEGLVEMFNSPRLPLAKKLQVLDKLISGKINSSSRNMIALLVNRNAVDRLSVIVNHFKGLVDEHNKVARGNITSAVPLSDKQLSKLQESLQGLIEHELILSNVVDESIIGGMVARIGDKLIDASLRHKINKMRSDLVR
tara:strand:- start:330 stop:860 length:531 start_codon:yes stop_codon:yes gene_type:complete